MLEHVSFPKNSQEEYVVVFHHSPDENHLHMNEPIPWSKWHPDSWMEGVCEG